MEKKNFLTKKNRIILGSVILLIMLTVTASLGYRFYNVMDNFNFTVTAEKEDANGITTDSGFILTAEKNYSKSAIRSAFSFEPALDFTVEKLASSRYLLKPEEELKENTIYNVKVRKNENEPALSWAFQTKTNFKVDSVLPRNLSTYVNLNTGIEVDFSMTPERAEEFFEITPKVEGRFESRDKKLIFIPEKLEKDTPYKVTLKKGLTSKSGEVLSEDYSFVFRTVPAEDYRNYSYLYLQNGFQETFTTAQKPMITFSGDEVFQKVPFQMDVYDLKTLDTYLGIIEQHTKNVYEEIGYVNDYLADVSGYEKLFTFSDYLKEDKKLWQKDVIFPEALNSGWYLADIQTVTEESRLQKHFQKLIQVSDLSVYLYSLNGETKVWCNDSTTGQAVSAATVKIGDLAAVTNKDGLASFSISSEDYKSIIIEEKSGKLFGEYQKLSAEEESNLQDLYYMYLYTDREYYLPTDTVKYWGMMIPKDSKTKLPEEILLSWDKDLPVKVNENGSFEGEIRFSNHISTYMELSIKAEGKEAYMKGICITEDTKPVYKLAATFDKPYYRNSEPVNLQVSGSFYDGTSAEGVSVTVNSNNDFYKTVVLDSDGLAYMTLTPQRTNEDGDYEYVYVNLMVSGIDEEASFYGSVPYFPTDYHIEGAWEETAGETSKLALSTNQVNYGAVKDGSVNYSEIYTDAAFSQAIQASVVQVESKKEKTGESYNYYTGKNEPVYRYYTVEKTMETFDISIPDSGKYERELPYQNGDNISYKLVLSYTFPDGFVGTKEVYLYNSNSYRMIRYFLQTDKESFATNETVNLSLAGDEFKGGRILYVVAKDKIKYSAITSEKDFSISFNKDLIPNCSVAGAYFDGKNTYVIDTKFLNFNAVEKEAEIEIISDKESYRPGDTVCLTLKADRMAGKKANMIVSVTDEAAFAASDTIVKPLDSLYRRSYHYPTVFSSYVDHELPIEGGEGGGGGEDGIRDNFVDNALFQAVTLKKDGTAEVSFELPDNLTSWRITAVAVSEDVLAGYQTKNISTSIPFFINPVLNTKYSAKDDFSFTVRTAGSASKLISSMVSYEATVTGNGVNLTKTLILKPGETGSFEFGKLKEGKYEVLIKAVSGEYEDAIKKTVTVVSSLQEVYLRKEVDIGNLAESVTAVKYPLKLIFFDAQNAKYYKALTKILTNSYGVTTEEEVSYRIAAEKMNEFMGKENFSNSTVETIQQYSGGISNLAYSEEDALLTAKIALAYPEGISEEAAKQYFYSVLQDFDSSEAEVTAAYLGLAALKAPVLNDIKYLLADSSDLTIEGQINLITALAVIGDQEMARKYYSEKISPNLVSEGDFRSFPNGEKTYEFTSRLIPVQAILNGSDFEGLLRYVIDKEADDYLPNLDLAVYFRYYRPTDAKSFVSYQLNHAKEKVDFSKTNVKILELDEQEFQNFRITKRKGDVTAYALYMGSLNEKEIGKEIEIVKEMDEENSFGNYTNVKLKITLPENAEKGYYEVSDMIPSGSRYVDLVSDQTYRSGFLHREGQKVKFYLYKREDDRNYFEINYKIRNIFKGEFVAESAIVSNFDGTLEGCSNPLTMKIR
ncbi:MAG: Ig-like domain-containing protein [Clostridia bacterium]|nr:Ig-like domain-containing protein [Clostridia bacterium]